MSPRQKTHPILESVADGFRLMKWLVVLLVVLFLGSGITTVRQDEVALVLRCGQLTGQTRGEQIHQPGLLLAWPYPIDRVIRVPVKQEREIVLDELAPSAMSSERSTSGTLDALKEGYCLSGDQNILQANLAARFRIVDPIAYQLHTHQPERLIRDVVIGAVTQTVARWKVDEALLLQRPIAVVIGQPRGAENLVSTAQAEAQRRLDALGCGVAVRLVVKEIVPPPQVKPEFDAVQSAKIDRQRVVRQAQGFAGRTLTAAQAQKQRLIDEATADAKVRVATARGDVEVFSNLYDEYRRSPQARQWVWDRVYIEALEEVFRKAKVNLFSPGTRFVVPRAPLKVERSDAPNSNGSDESSIRSGGFQLGTEGAR